MIIYFADRQMNILGKASTGLPKGILLVDDEKVKSLDEGVSTFECEVVYDEDTRALCEEMTTPGNYILREHQNTHEYEYYTIIDTEQDNIDRSIRIYAEDGGMDLLNDTYGPYTAPEAKPVSFYVDKFTFDSGFELGLNEIPDLTRKLTWDGEGTGLERLLSVCNSFDDAELSFSFDIDKMTVRHKYVNIHTRRGTDSARALKMGKEVSRIKCNRSIANLGTSVFATGAIPENAEEPINLVGYSYDDGDIFVSPDGYCISRSMREKWSRYQSEDGSWRGAGAILKFYSYETESKSELCNRTVKYLKSICDMTEEYTVELLYLPDDVDIGDTVDIVDVSGDVYLSGRIRELRESIANDKVEVVLGEFVQKTSGISQQLQELSEKYQKIAAAKSLYTWTVYADDSSGTGITTDPMGKLYMGVAVNKTVQTPDLTDPSLYAWSRVKGDDGEDATVLRVDSTRGLVFKNDWYDTELHVTVIHGSRIITTLQDLRDEYGSSAHLEWFWRKQADQQWRTMSADDSHITQGGFVMQVTPQDVDEQILFQCDLVV